MPEVHAEERAVSTPTRKGEARVRRAERRQVRMQAFALDELLPEDHPARLVWEYVEGLDVSALYEPIRSVKGRAGRDAVDPKILLALWLYATLDGVGAARQLDRLCREPAAYQWICGGVSTNYHTLSDFRVGHTAFLDELLTRSVATLMHEGLVTLNRVAQDGMRVRASAGAASFRRRETLEACQAEAREQVEALRAEVASDPSAGTRRRPAARRRAARERSERIAKALEEMPQAEAKKTPDEMLVDGGFAKHEDIERVSAPDNGTTVYAPVQKPKKDDRDVHLPRPGDSETIAAWRRRMGTDEAKAIYKERASTAECVNAIARNRGLRQFLVRGWEKVRAVALWYALAHNLMRAVALRAEAAPAVA